MAKRRVLKWVNLGLSVLVGGGLIYGLSHSIGPVPAMAQAFNPGSGVWTATKVEVLPHTENLNIAGLQQNVQIIFEKDGTAHIQAATDHDAWVAVGYLHAKNRLLQMDLERRQGAGLLSEVVGSAGLPSDKFQRQLGLDRTAQAEWNSLKPDDELRQTLEAYTAGINDVIDDETQHDTLPMMFKILGYKPSKWQPQDTLIIQGVLTQMLSLSSAPVTYAMLSDTLGYNRTMDLLPLLPSNRETPYDNGPYKHDPLMAMPISPEAVFQGQTATASNTVPSTTVALSSVATATTTNPAPVSTTSSVASTATQSAAVSSVMNLVNVLDELPSYALQTNTMNSNAWAVDGTKTVSGKPLMAGDPHLQLTLPSTWYQMQVDSPSYHFSGVSVPGLPAILIGRNQNMSWTMTNGSNEQTFYYQEQMDAAHPNQYYYKGQWRNLDVIHETIPVKGGQEVPFDIKSTIHGPLVGAGSPIFTNGKTYSIDWVGSIPSNSLRAILDVSKVKNYEEFKSALSDWRAPTMNFVYADNQGNIGLYGAGWYPVLGQDSKPWLPLRGTGEDDITGAVPYADIPQTYNPPSHIIVTGNQREVKNDYPYYVGTTVYFEPSYRANRIFDQLATDQKLSEQDFEHIQNDTHDIVASEIVPVLLKNLADANLNAQEKQALSQLTSWDYDMKNDSVAASLWWMFWNTYMTDTVQPWFEHDKVPAKVIEKRINPNNMGMNESLETWTLNDPNNAFFNNPVTGQKRDAKDVMIQAFHDSVANLKAKQGDDMSKWTWANVHTRHLTSLTQIPALGYAAAANGDSFTVDVATDWSSDHGPSWRMIVDWGNGQSVGIYPGGQSENPLSPWYSDRIQPWWNGKYSPMQTFDQAQANQDNVHWSLSPSR